MGDTAAPKISSFNILIVVSLVFVCLRVLFVYFLFFGGGGGGWGSCCFVYLPGQPVRP